MPLWLLWLIVCAAAGVLVAFRPGWWLVTLACLAMLAGAAPVAVALIATGLWLLLWAARTWRSGRVAS